MKIYDNPNPFPNRATARIRTARERIRIWEESQAEKLNSIREAQKTQENMNRTSEKW